MWWIDADESEGQFPLFEFLDFLMNSPSCEVGEVCPCVPTRTTEWNCRNMFWTKGVLDIGELMRFPRVVDLQYHMADISFDGPDDMLCNIHKMSFEIEDEYEVRLREL